MTNVLEFEFALKRCNKTKREVAQKLGISETALYNKLNGDSEFKASEIAKAEKFLNLTPSETKKIFLPI